MSKRILTGVFPENDYRSYIRHSDEVEQKYGLPNKKKYPMPDRDHVMSAIKFFNYVSPADEKELAKNILARIKEYGITDINVGENNRFGKYYKSDHLEHHGILGMKWGVRRYQNSDGSLTTAGKKRYSGNGETSGGDSGTVSIKRLKNDIKASTKGIRYNFEMSKDLASKESVKTIAKSTQPDYEKLMVAGKKYRQLYDKGKHTDADVDEYMKARDAYQNALKNVANKALGDMKDQEVRFAYDWDGKTYRDGRETLSDTMAGALHQANIERNKSRR